GSMNVVLADLNEQGAIAAAKALNGTGATAIGLGVDVSDRASVLAMIERARQVFGPVYALFNNAGICQSGSTVDIDEAEWDLVVNTHVKGAYLCTQAALPDMIAQGGGAIVNMA